MPVLRGTNFKQVPVKISGSSVYGIYPKISNERTYNFFMSDGFLAPYPGYKIGLSSSLFQSSLEGRALYASVKLNLIFAVFDNKFYQISLTYDHLTAEINNYQITILGTLQTSTGVCYIAENNKPQILISDGTALYVYDMTKSVSSTPFTTNYGSNNKLITLSSPVVLDIGDPVTFTGGSLPSGLTAGTTYYVSATGLSSTTIELALTPTNAYLGSPTIDIGSDGSGNVNTLGAFQTPLINFIPGYINFHDTYFLVAASSDNYYTPAANNTYRLSAQNNGNLFPDTAQTIGLLETKPDNTQAVVRFPSKGNMILVMGKSVTEFWFDTGAQLFPYQRTNQGSIDYGCLNPATVASMDEIVVWLARNEKSGPIIMYSTGGEPKKVTTDGIDYQLSEIENPEASQGFLFRKNGHLFYHLNFYIDQLSFVVDFNTNKIYNACDQNLSYYSMGQVIWYNNQYFSITKDNGNFFIFDTIFSTYQTVDSMNNVVEFEIPRIRTTNNIRLPSQDYFIANDIGFTIESGETDYHQSNSLPPYTPRVDLSVSFDGGATFGSDFPYVLPGIGQRKNRLMWWQLGMGNDMVFQFKFVGWGRFTATDGVLNIRQ